LPGNNPRTIRAYADWGIASRRRSSRKPPFLQQRTVATVAVRAKQTAECHQQKSTLGRDLGGARSLRRTGKAR